MGAYLSHPVTDKHSQDERNGRLKCGASSMQGWRVFQEDAHNCVLDFAEGVSASLFAVYDGHGGKEVAEYTAQTLPDVILRTEAWKADDYGQALKEAFLKYDESLTEPDVMATLKAIAAESSSTSSKGNAETIDEGENIGSLREEAAMPLEQLIARYRHGRVTESAAKPAASSTSCDTDAVSSSNSTTTTATTSSSSASASTADCAEASSSGVSPKKSRTSLAEKYGNGEILAENTVNSSADVVDCLSKGNIQNKEDSDGQVSSSSVETGSVTESSQTSRVTNSVTKNVADDDDSSDSDENFPEQASSTSGEKEDDEDDDDDDEEEEDDDDDDEDGEGGIEDEDEFSMKMTDELVAAIKGGKPLSKERNDDGDDEEEEEEEEEARARVEEEEDAGDDEGIGRRFLIDALTPKRPGNDSGCTAVVALVLPDRVLVANAGDSRCVACKDGKAIDLSVDHKPEDEVEYARISKAGGKVSADGRVNGGLNLSRALGDHVYKKVAGLPLEEQMISPMPDIHEIEITEDVEFLVLACDGIWNYMTSQEVVDYVRERLKKNPTNLSSICEELFDHCLAPHTMGDGTGCDNMTAVIVQFRPPPESQQECSKRRSDQETDNQPSKKKSKTDDTNFPTTAP